MSKKNTKVEETEQVAENVNTVTNPDEMTPEQMAQARKEMREAMKERFGKWMEIYDEDATDADIDAARQEFETKVEEWKNRNYLLAEKDKAVDTLKFLIDWNAKCNRWEKGAWRGVIAFNDIMNKKLVELEATPEDLMIDYQTLIFLNASMANPVGFGLESAKAMCEMENYDLENNKPFEDDKVTYSDILQTVFKHVNMLQAADRMLNLYRERITMAAAGLKVDFKITELEEFKELHDAWVVPTEDEVRNAL